PTSRESALIPVTDPEGVPPSSRPRSRSRISSHVTGIKGAASSTLLTDDGKQRLTCDDPVVERVDEAVDLLSLLMALARDDNGVERARSVREVDEHRERLALVDRLEAAGDFANRCDSTRDGRLVEI